MQKKWILAVLVLTIVTVSWTHFLDNYSDKYTDKVLVSSAASFAVARGLNAVISVLQSTTLSFSFFGGVSVGIGESLDPLNDLIERFSWLAAAAMASIGIQKLLLLFASHTLFKVFVTLAGVATIVSRFKMTENWNRKLIRLFIVAIFLRFAVGLVVTANIWVEKTFLAEKRVTATEQLTTSKNYLKSFDFEIFAKENKEKKAPMGDELKEEVESATNTIIDLLVVFIAQTFLFPILFLCGIYLIARHLYKVEWSPIK